MGSHDLEKLRAIIRGEYQSDVSSDASPPPKLVANSADEKGQTHNSTTPDEADNSNQDNPEEDTREYPSFWKLFVICIGLCLVVFCMALDNTIIAVAIPRITDQFNSLNDVGWYASAYLLTTCAFQLLYGKIYTFFSIKWVFVSAVVIFEIGSAVCGSAPSSAALIVGRAVAGLGASGVFSGALLIIAHTVPLQKRPIYSGLIGGMYGIASVAGPLLGGVFTDSYLTWRWCFYINLPLGAVTLMFIIPFLKLPKEQTVQEKLTWRDSWTKLDVPGVAVLLPCIVCLLLALQWGGSTYAWDSGRIIALLVLTGVLAIAFGVIQIWKGDNATLPLRIVKNRSMLGSIIFSTSLGASFFVLIYWVPIWFQAIKGVDATHSGIDSLPMILAVTVFSIATGIAVSVTGYYNPWVILSSVLMSAGAGAITTFKVNTSTPTWIGLQILYGAGVGSGMQQTVMCVQTVLPLKDVPVGTALVIFSQTLGGALFASVAQNIFTNELIKNLATEVPHFSPRVIVATGATRFRDFVPAKLLEPVLIAYNKALTQTFNISVAMSAVSIIGAVMLEWKSMKSKPKPAAAVAAA